MRVDGGNKLFQKNLKMVLTSQQFDAIIYDVVNDRWIRR